MGNNCERRKIGGKNMVCPKCNSQNVNVTVVQTNAKTRNRGRGCLWSIGRLTLIICTCGLWLLVGKSKGKGKTKFANETQAVCQNCGYRWSI